MLLMLDSKIKYFSKTQLKIITQKPKTLGYTNIVGIKSVIKEHPKTMAEVQKLRLQDTMKRFPK